MAFTKITSTDLANKGVIGLPDVPGLSTSDMQNKLEETARSVIIPKHNALIDELEDTSAAASLGATAPSGLSGENVQALINDLNLKKENNSSSLPATNTAEGSDTFNIRKNTTTYKITFSNLVASIKAAIGEATTAIAGLFSAEDKAKLNGIENNANNYSLPIASDSVLGGVKVGEHLSIDSEGVLSLEGGDVYSVNGKTGIVVLGASDVNALPDNTPIPAKVSDLTNDSGYQTASDVSTSINTALTPYQTKNLSSSIAGQSTVEGAIGANATAIDVLNSSDSVSGSVAKTVKDAINALDKSDSAVEGSYVTAVSETNGQITVTREAADTAPTVDSNKMITSGAVYEMQSGQQQLLEDTVGWNGKNLLYDAETYIFDKAEVIGTRIHSFHLSKLPKIGDKFKVALRLTDVVVNPSHDSKDVLFVRIGTSTTYSGGAVYFDVSTSGQQIVELEVNSEIPSLSNATIYMGIRNTSGWTASLTVNDLMAYDANITDSTYTPYHASVEESKADNSIIAPVENGTTASQAYAVGSHFIRNGKFCTVTTAISADESLVGSSKFSSGDISSEIEKFLTLSSTVSITSLDDVSIGTGYATFYASVSPTGSNIGAPYLCFGNVNYKTIILYRGTDHTLYINRLGSGVWSGWFKIELSAL